MKLSAIRVCSCSQSNDNGNTEAPHHWHLKGKSTDDRRIPITKGQWCGACCIVMRPIYPFSQYQILPVAHSLLSRWHPTSQLLLSLHRVVQLGPELNGPCLTDILNAFPYLYTGWSRERQCMAFSWHVSWQLTFVVEYHYITPLRVQEL